MSTMTATAEDQLVDRIYAAAPRDTIEPGGRTVQPHPKRPLEIKSIQAVAAPFEAMIDRCVPRTRLQPMTTGEGPTVRPFSHQ